MMHQNVAATTQFDLPSVCVVAVDGDPDTLGLYEPTNSRSWLTMDDPVDVRDYR